jgi:hypothetical protein
MLKTKITATMTRPRILALSMLLLLAAFSSSGYLKEQTFTQGYNADQPLNRGTLVKLKDGDPTFVEPVTRENIEKTHGVVVDANDAPVTLSGEGNQVFVASAGQFEVLVTNQNGSIEPGDYITVSALSGVGMKADTVMPVVAGKAQSGFDGQSGVVSAAEIKDAAGQSRQLKLGRIAMEIGIGSNPLVKPTQTNLPDYLKKFSEAIANKPVSADKVYLALGVFMGSALLSGSLLYAGTRSGITALGRNPLSRGLIKKSLLQVVLLSIIILLGGVFGLYLLLKL